jgi:hypothetical protein
MCWTRRGLWGPSCEAQRQTWSLRKQSPDAIATLQPVQTPVPVAPGRRISFCGESLLDLTSAPHENDGTVPNGIVRTTISRTQGRGQWNQYRSSACRRAIRLGDTHCAGREGSRPREHTGAPAQPGGLGHPSARQDTRAAARGGGDWRVAGNHRLRRRGIRWTASRSGRSRGCSTQRQLDLHHNQHGRAAADPPIRNQLPASRKVPTDSRIAPPSILYSPRWLRPSTYWRTL